GGCCVRVQRPAGARVGGNPPGEDGGQPHSGRRAARIASRHPSPIEVRSMRVPPSVGRRPRGGGILGVAAAGVAIACAGVPAPATAFAAGHGPVGGRHGLPGYVPLWTLPPKVGGTDSADLGPAPAGAPIATRVYLAGRDPRGLAAYAAAVADPHGALFHRYLT